MVGDAMVWAALAAVGTLPPADPTVAVTAEVVQGPCTQVPVLDPRGDAAVDVEVVTVTLDCGTDAWTVSMAALSGPVAGAVEAVELWFDTDANPRNGCDGFERLVRAGSAGSGAYAVSSCRTPPARTGDVEYGGPSEIRWPAAAIGSPRNTIRFRAVVAGAGGSTDVVPSSGAAAFWGPDGPTVVLPPLPPGPTTWNGRCEIPTWPLHIRNPLIRLYYAYFHRDALGDPAGLAYWEQQHGSGAMCLTEVSEYFARSAEFVGTYGNLADAEFIRRVYLNVLGREPDPEGYAHWASQLAAGRVRRGTMMVGFSESPEFRSVSGVP